MSPAAQQRFPSNVVHFMRRKALRFSDRVSYEHMTLIVSAFGRRSIWMLGDRRLSYPHRAPVDDACKILGFEASDGSSALFGYSGLGATASGVQPSDWMARLLRGRGLSLQGALAELARAVRLRLPIHVNQLEQRSHVIVVAALADGEPQLYQIDIARPADHSDYRSRFLRHVTKNRNGRGALPPRVAASGSGIAKLQELKNWDRELIGIVNAHDEGRVSAHAVASYLAGLNTRVFELMKRDDRRSVGRQCVVAWQVCGEPIRHVTFDGTEREAMNSVLPIVSHGHDVKTIVDIVWRDICLSNRQDSSDLSQDAMMQLERARTPDDSLD